MMTHQTHPNTLYPIQNQNCSETQLYTITPGETPREKRWVSLGIFETADV